MEKRECHHSCSLFHLTLLDSISFPVESKRQLNMSFKMPTPCAQCMIYFTLIQEISENTVSPSTGNMNSKWQQWVEEWGETFGEGVLDGEMESITQRIRRQRGHWACQNIPAPACVIYPQRCSDCGVETGMGNWMEVDRNIESCPVRWLFWKIRLFFFPLAFWDEIIWHNSGGQRPRGRRNGDWKSRDMEQQQEHWHRCSVCYGAPCKDDFRIQDMLLNLIVLKVLRKKQAVTNTFW